MSSFQEPVKPLPPSTSPYAQGNVYYGQPQPPPPQPSTYPGVYQPAAYSATTPAPPPPQTGACATPAYYDYAGSATNAPVGYGKPDANYQHQQYYNYGNTNPAHPTSTNAPGRSGASGYPEYGPPHPAPTAAGNTVPFQPQPQAPTATPAYYDYTAPSNYNEVLESKGSNKWETSLCCAPCKDPCFFCVSCMCPWCCVWTQRKKLLMGEWSRYMCCAGICGNCRWCVCSGAEPCCMCMEAALCLVCAVHGNRYMVMQHYNLGTDFCDMAVMCFACILQIVGAILNYQWLQVLADCVYCAVIGCLLTQNEVQMKKFGYPKGQNMQ